jgi:hypothetical protein
MQATLAANGKIVLDTAVNANAVLIPTLVAKAHRGADLKALIKAAEAELKGIGKDLDAAMAESGFDYGTDAAGVKVCGHGGRIVQAFQTEAFREAHPALAAEFTAPRTDRWVTYGN